MQHHHSSINTISLKHFKTEHRMNHIELKFMTELNLRHSKVGSGRQSTWHHFSPPVCFSTSLIKQMNN